MIRLWLAVLVVMAVSSSASAESKDDGAKDELRDAIEKNWLIPLGLTNMEKCDVSLRLHMTPEGVVNKIDVLGDDSDPDCHTIAESARRAILITQAELGHLPVQRDNYNPTIIVRWPMKVICEERGGC